MGGWEPEDGEGFRDGVLKPGGELRGGLRVTGGDLQKRGCFMAFAHTVSHP